MTTREAFEDLLNHRAWWKGIYRNKDAGASLKHQHLKGLVKETFMEEILIKAGYPVLQEKIWGKKKEE
jgi:hypothetical protein